MAFTLAYKERNSRPTDGTWGMGSRWESSRLSYVQVDSGVPGEARLYSAQGGLRTYTTDGQTVEYRTRTRMSEEAPGNYQITGIRLTGTGHSGTV